MSPVSAADERNLVVTITGAGEALKEKAITISAAIAKCSNSEPEEAAMRYRMHGFDIATKASTTLAAMEQRIAFMNRMI